MSRAKTLFDRLRIDDRALVLYSFSHLKLKHRQVLKRAYGEDLMGEFQSQYLSEEEKKNVVFSAIRSLKNIIDNTEILTVTIYPDQVGEDSKVFYERFGEYNPCDVLTIFDTLGDEYKEVFHKVYGSHLLHEGDIYSLTDSEKILFFEGISILKKTLSSFHKVSHSQPDTYVLGYQYIAKKRGTKSKNIFELNPNYSSKEVLSAIEKLEDEERKDLICGYGNSFDNLIGYNQMNEKQKKHLMWIIRGPLKYFLEHPEEKIIKKNPVESLIHPYDFFSDYSSEEIDEAIMRLPESDRKIVMKVFDSAQFITNRKMSHNDYLKLKNIFEFQLPKLLLYVRKTQTIIGYFQEYSIEEILNDISQMSNNHIHFLRNLYGTNFDEKRKYLSTMEEICKLDFLLKTLKMHIQNEEVYRMNIGERKIRKRKQNTVTSDFVHDRLSDLPYQKLSRQEEVDFIKKTRLSYYHSVDDETKQLYLDYYMEMFPRFRKSWEEADEKKKERLLEKAIQNSLYYRNKFIENNLRLVLSVAKHYVGADEIEPLYQEGVLGMMRALEKFDLTKGFRFSTYATLWIRQAITRYISDYSSTIRVPVHRRDQISRMERFENILTTKFGRAPTKEELAEVLEIDSDQLYEIQKSQSFLRPTSLSSPIGEDEDTTLEDFVPNGEEEIALNVESNMMRKAFRDVIENDLKLSEREKKVLFMRFGFYDGHPYTLDEIGKCFMVTRERIRQIEAKCLKTLRMHLKESSFRDTDFSLGSASEDDFIPLDYTFPRKRIAQPDVVQSTSRDFNGNVHTHKRLAFNLDSNQINDILLEVLSRTDMNQFDQDTRDILNLRYGLCGVKVSVTDTARILNLSDLVVQEKEDTALKIIFSQLTDLEPEIEQVKRMIMKK